MTTTAARSLADIFPTKPCGRCGGCGHYSYNQIDGDRCYGCGGTGRAWATRKVADAVEIYRTAVRRQREPLVSQLAGGDEVLASLSATVRKGDRWVAVAHVERTGDVCGWSGAEHTPSSWYHVVTLEDGTSRRLPGNQIVRRRMREPLDPAPFLAACL